MDRLDDLQRFYAILAQIEARLGDKLKLRDCHQRIGWPARGVYFFFEEGEHRTDSGVGLRVVRVGTHALGQSKATLQNRLSQHRGIIRDGSGNHRGSIFRLLVGSAIKERDGFAEPRSWGIGGDYRQAATRVGMASEAVKEAEILLECAVTSHIKAMPFIFVAELDPPGPESMRGYIERNSIGLLSNYRRDALDIPSARWLGRHSDREKVRESGLWNNRHVDEGYDPGFLNILKRLAQETPLLAIR
ncbi:hypothetical protein PTE30175_03557 [Pandoraea terrae]|uniref:GIY-YIG domain-containing protein n=1 Tax=Pandoraea terrae TaxID=1537710 RepID=A0A5E4X442_9BURK|nr:hypothetical protein [Pandoraea terrae]VVE31073.1 hypothetical protein PTE30175_03557 [Pandoraea terrae]